MAYLATQPDEEENTPSGVVQSQPGQITTTSPSAQAIRPTALDSSSEMPTVSGPGGTLAAGGSGIAGPAPSTRGAAGVNRTGGATDFQRILEANREQASGMAERVGAETETGVRSSLDQAREEALATFTERADQPDLNEALLSRVEQAPSEVLMDPTARSEFEAILSGQYAGPTEFAGDTQAAWANALTQATEAGERLQTPTGIRETFARQSDRPAPGRDAFDVALLQGVPGAREYLRDLGQTLEGVGESADETVRQQMADIVDQQQEEAAQQATSTRRRYEQDVLPSFQERLTEEARRLQDQAIEQQQAIDLALAGEQDLTNDQLSALGITAEEYDALRSDPNLRLQDYLQPIDAGFDITPQEFATPEDYAYYNALQQLLGEEPEFLTDQYMSGDYTTDATDYMLEDALRGQRALEVQRLGLPEEPEYIPRENINDSEPGDKDWTDQVHAQYDRIRRDYNLADDTQFQLKRTEDKNQMIRDGWTEVAQMEIKGRRDRSIFIKPGASGTFLPTTERETLYDRTTGETIEAGDIPLPLLYALMEQDQQANQAPTSSPSYPELTQEQIEDLVRNINIGGLF